MERISSDDCRDQARVCRALGVNGTAQVLEDAAYTIDEMDKDMAIMEINREALRRALYEEQL